MRVTNIIGKIASATHCVRGRLEGKGRWRYVVCPGGRLSAYKPHAARFDPATAADFAAEYARLNPRWEFSVVGQ